MASDIDASTQDLLHRSLDPVRSTLQPTANFSSFGADRLVALDSDSLNSKQAELVNRLSNQSKNTFAPTVDINSFRNRVPNQSDLRSSLVGSSTTPRLNLDATNSVGTTASTSTLNATSPEATSIADGSFFAGFFTPGVRSTSVRSSSIGRQQPSVQWVGAFCDIDGTEVFPTQLSGPANGVQIPEGEGPGDGGSSGSPLVPNVDFPTLESSQHSGSLDSFYPPSPTTSSSLTTFGSFTASSLTNPDLTLPGLHWVHSVDVYWVSSTQWSFTESLVLAYNLTNSVEEEGDSSTSGDGTGTDGNNGDGNGDEPDTDGLDVESDWESTMEASRNGFFKFTFGASRGITTASAAGVAWSLWVNYLDSATVVGEASGSADFTATAATPGSPGSGDSPGTNEGLQSNSTYPNDFTASSEWNATAGISITTAGGILISSTPSIATGGIVERSIVASISYNVDGDIDVSDDWTSSSQSGNISFPDTPVAGNPLLCFGDEIFADNPDEPVNAPSPMGNVQGEGHASMSNGQTSQTVGGGLTGSFDLTGVLRGGQFASLAGHAISQLDEAKASSGDGSHKFVARDQIVTPTLHGQTVTTLVLTAGWKGVGEGDGNADNVGDIELSVGADGVPVVDNDSTGEVDGDGQANGNDFIDLRLNEDSSEAWDYVSLDDGAGPTHAVGSSSGNYALIYTSKSKGKTIGDVNGFASAQNQDADFESDLEGKGRSVLTIHASDQDSDTLTVSTSNGPLLYEQDYFNDSNERYVNKYTIDGGATGGKNNDGSVTWTIDVTIESDLEIKYGSIHDYDDIEENSTLSGYDFTRVAEFEGSKSTTSTLTGGGTISPQPGGDTGGLTTTETSTRAGDTEVSFFVIGSSGSWEQKFALELEIEGMLNGNPGQNGGTNGSGSGSGGNSGSNGSGGYQGGNTELGSDSGSGSGNGTFSWTYGVTSGFFKGVAQGACNLANGVQDAAVGVVNIAIAIPNTVAGGIDYATGATDPNYQIRIPYVTSPDWSRNLVTEEGGTQGGWDDTHGWSKWAGGEGAVALLTGGASKAASAVDEAGLCGNFFAKFVNGGCFVAGTVVTVSEMPYSSDRETALWSKTDWLDDRLEAGDWRRETSDLLMESRLSRLPSANSQLSTSNSQHLLIPIEQVPIGARVPTKNPKPWEYDDSLPDPVQSEWGKISITLHRNDGGIVDAELIRPRSWIKKHGIQANTRLPINIPELEVTGLAFVNSVEDCPEIAMGEGSIITGRFLTREVNTIIRAEIMGPDGTIETLEGTPIHPVWSVDRNNWVPLGELQNCEQLLGHGRTVVVRSHTILNYSIIVYNLEVHGEHVYEVGQTGLLVHNAYVENVVDIRKLLPSLARDHADPVKLERMGAFDWALYKPIQLVREGALLRIQSGMTRVEAALRAGITKLPAHIFSE